MSQQCDPNRESGVKSSDVAKRTIHWRAVEVVIWGMPAVDTELMIKGLQSKGDFNQILYWSRSRSEKRRRRLWVASARPHF